jgi:hypothetical protein
VGVRKIKGKSLNVTVPKHERQTLFTWTAAKLKHHGRNGQVLAWSKQKSAIQREEKVSQPNDQRMPIKKQRRRDWGLYLQILLQPIITRDQKTTHVCLLSYW